MTKNYGGLMGVYSSSVDISYFKFIKNSILFESTDHVTQAEYRYYSSFVSLIILEYQFIIAHLLINEIGKNEVMMNASIILASQQ